MHTDTTEQERSGNALDLLEREDRELRSMFNEIRANRKPAVTARARYGDLAKAVIRRVSIRESALVELESEASQVAGLRGVAETLERQAQRRRPAIDRVEKLSRGVQGMNLNVGQDFDSELLDLMDIIGSEIEWDLGEAIPALRHSLERSGRLDNLKGAKTLRKRAPTNLQPDRARWWERAPVVSRLLTIYDRLRDFPKGQEL